MANFGKRPQPYRVQWPLSASQAENIDEMFGILFKRIGQVQQSIETTDATVASAVTAQMMSYDDNNDEPAIPPALHGGGGSILTSLIRLFDPNLAAVSTDGAVLENSTFATAGVLVQMPPRLRFRGNAWDGAATKTVDAWWELLPQSGTVRGQIKLCMSINGGATFNTVVIDSNPTSNASVLTLGGAGAFRGGDGTAASPVFGFVNSGGGGAIGFYTPAANDLNLVCNSANMILWGANLWRSASSMPFCWSSAVDPNTAVGDTAMIRKAAAKLTFYNKPEGTPDAGFVLDFSVDAIAGFRNRADSAFATVDCLDIKTENATFLHRTGTALTNNAAANVGTLNNGPTAGNPTKWIAIDDNGTTRYIPAW